MPFVMLELKTAPVLGEPPLESCFHGNQLIRKWWFCCSRKKKGTSRGPPPLEPMIGENRLLVTDEPVEFEEKLVESKTARRLLIILEGFVEEYNSI
jgi:hypothetical protein